MLAVLGLLIIRSIVSALNAAVSIADRIASGELGNDVRVESRDELGRLLEALKRMDGKLVEIVGGVRGSGLGTRHGVESLRQFASVQVVLEDRPLLDLLGRLVEPYLRYPYREVTLRWLRRLTRALS